VQNLSDSALIEQMFGYAASLQRLWTSTTDDELAALCQRYPGFVRYATLMENLSETLRTGVGVPAHIKELPPLPEVLKQAMIKLMSDGAELERGLQQRIEDGRPRRPQKAKVPEGPPPSRRDLEDLYQRWSRDFASLVAAAGAAALPATAKRLLLQSVQSLGMRIEQLHTTASSSAAVAEHHKVSAFRAPMTVNRQFMADFLAADAPCFALGLVEERKRRSGFLALRPERPIPAHVTDVGFRLGVGLIGTNEFEVIDLVFEFYGHALYHGLLNPNNPAVREVLATMVAAQDYVFFTVNTGSGAATCFRSELGAGFIENMARIQRSTTTEAQYRRAVEGFSRRPEPPGMMLNWVCRENRDYLDLTHHRLEMSPSR
jgi:hypothetical protein